MLILTTSKRIHQFTALTFVILASVAALLIYQHYDRYSAQPEVLQQTLLSVIDQSKDLPKTVYDPVAIAEEATQLTMAQIKADLSRANVPDADTSAKLLLTQATAFLQDEDSLHTWLERYLNDLSLPETQLVVTSPELDRQILQAGETCLVIARQQHRWQLVSLLTCQ